MGRPSSSDETHILGTVHNQTSFGWATAARLDAHGNFVFTANGALEFDRRCDARRRRRNLAAARRPRPEQQRGRRDCGDQPGIERTLTNLDNRIHGKARSASTPDIPTEFGAPADGGRDQPAAASSRRIAAVRGATTRTVTGSISSGSISPTRERSGRPIRAGCSSATPRSTTPAAGSPPRTPLANVLTHPHSTVGGGVIGAEGETLVLDTSTITNAQIEANNWRSLQIFNTVDASTSTFAVAVASSFHRQCSLKAGTFAGRDAERSPISARTVRSSSATAIRSGDLPQGSRQRRAR